MQRFSTLLLVSSLLAGTCDAFAPSIPVTKAPGSMMRASMGARRDFSGRSAPLRPSMLVDVPKQVLVTGASGRTGFATFKVRMRSAISLAAMPRRGGRMGSVFQKSQKGGQTSTLKDRLLDHPLLLLPSPFPRFALSSSFSGRTRSSLSRRVSSIPQRGPRCLRSSGLRSGTVMPSRPQTPS